MEAIERKVLFIVENERDFDKDIVVRNTFNDKMFTVSWDFFKNPSSIFLSSVNKDKVLSINKVLIKEESRTSNLLRLKKKKSDLELKLADGLKKKYTLSFPLDFRKHKQGNMYIIKIFYTTPKYMGKAI